jgi:hypothetical protein
MSKYVGPGSDGENMDSDPAKDLDPTRSGSPILDTMKSTPPAPPQRFISNGSKQETFSFYFVCMQIRPLFPTVHDNNIISCIISTLMSVYTL